MEKDDKNKKQRRVEIDRFLKMLKFQAWLTRLNYNYRQDYKNKCIREGRKPNWVTGYYEYLLSREDAGS